MGKFKDFFVGDLPLYKRFLLGIINYLNNNLLFLGFVFLCVLDSTLLRMMTLHDYFYIKPFLADVAVIMIVGLIGYFIRPSRRFVYYIVLISALSLLNFGNSVYYTNFKSFVSASQIATAAQLSGVMDAVTHNIMEFKDILFFLPVVLYIILYIFIRKKKKADFI